MHQLRISRTVLLSVALLIGIVSLFAPLVHSIVVYGADATLTEVEEQYGWFGIDKTKEGTLDVGHSSFETTWFDSSLDDTGGITYLRAAAPLFLMGFVLVAVSLILTLVNKTGDGRSGGITAAFGFASWVLAFTLHGWGLVLRNDNVFVHAWIPELMVVGYFFVFAIIMVLAAAFLGMVATSESQTVSFGSGQSSRMTIGTGHGSDRPRYFQCNDCGHVERVHGTARPICSACGNDTPV